MIQYFDDGDLACVDGFSFRRDKKTGYYLSSKKIDGKRKRLHVYMWEKKNGNAPKGYHVHHIDGNKRNNDIVNLTLLPGADHLSEHMLDEKRKENSRKAIKMATEAAKEWHHSEEGRKWHSDHAKQTMRNRSPLKYTCDNCGDEFESKKIYSATDNKFCSNKCKAAFRRKSGVDDVIKVCEVCGKEYVANKYQKTTRCADCKNRNLRRGTGV